MSNETKTKIDENNPKPIDKFLMDKTYQSIVETSKNIQVYSGIFVILIAVISIVVFSEAVEDMISVPFLGLKLQRWYAAEVFMVAIAANFYRFFALQAYVVLISHKFALLLKESGAETYPWHINYPSVFNFHGLITTIQPPDLLPKRVKIIPKILILFYSIFGIIYPLFVAWFIGSAVNFGWHWWISCGLAVILIVSTLIITFGMPGKLKRGIFIGIMESNMKL